MILLRFFLIAFNVAIITFLVFRMIEVLRKPIEKSKKTIFLVGGVLLLLAPFGIFLRFFAPTPQYFIVYPVAIFMFLYLTKQLSIK